MNNSHLPRVLNDIVTAYCSIWQQFLLAPDRCPYPIESVLMNACQNDQLHQFAHLLKHFQFSELYANLVSPRMFLFLAKMENCSWSHVEQEYIPSYNMIAGYIHAARINNAVALSILCQGFDPSIFHKAEEATSSPEILSIIRDQYSRYY